MPEQRIADILSRESIIVDRIRRRKRSVMDIRPLILDLYLDPALTTSSPTFPSATAAICVRIRLSNFWTLQDIHHSVHRFSLHTMQH